MSWITIKIIVLLTTTTTAVSTVIAREMVIVLSAILIRTLQGYQRTVSAVDHLPNDQHHLPYYHHLQEDVGSMLIMLLPSLHQ
jgi:hypothetical protein